MNVVVHVPNHGVACQATETTLNPSTTKSEKDPETEKRASTEPDNTQTGHVEIR